MVRSGALYIYSTGRPASFSAPDRGWSSAGRGFGAVSGVVIAVLSLQFLSSGFNMLRFSNFAKEFTWGAFLLNFMVLNYFYNKRTKKRFRIND